MGSGGEATQEEGLVSLWDENGEKSEVSSYQDGKQEGLQTTWHENGETTKCRRSSVRTHDLR